MTDDATDWPTPAEAEVAGTLLATLQRDLEAMFPGRGQNLFVHAVLISAAELFHRLAEEDALSDIMPACKPEPCRGDWCGRADVVWRCQLGVQPPNHRLREAPLSGLPGFLCPVPSVPSRKGRPFSIPRAIT